MKIINQFIFYNIISFARQCLHFKKIIYRKLFYNLHEMQYVNNDRILLYFSFNRIEHP